MKEKCTKYESLFTFRSEEELMQHIEECEDCRLEHEKMQKVSELIKEVKPYFRERRRNLAKVKVACALPGDAKTSFTKNRLNFFLRYI